MVKLVLGVMGGVQMFMLGAIFKHLWGHPKNEDIVTKELHAMALRHVTDTLDRIEKTNQESHERLDKKLDKLNGGRT